MTLVDLPAPPVAWRGSEHHAAVLGSPIDHSLSPLLHSAAYRALGIPWVYSRREVQRDDLVDVLAETSDRDVGFSLTMPLKETALRLSDDHTQRAALVGAANTLVRRGEAWLADNTDIVGIVEAVAESNPDGRALRTVTILGAGATARTAAVAACMLGATDVVVVGRRVAAAEEVAELARSSGATASVHEWIVAPELLSAELVISTVPSGVADGIAATVPAAPGLLLDVVYAPWPTHLAGAWLAKGGVAIPGTRMLLHQAVRQVELMTGVQGPIHRMREALIADGAAV